LSKRRHRNTVWADFNPATVGGSPAFLRPHHGNFAIDNIQILKYRILRQKGMRFFICCGGTLIRMSEYGWYRFEWDDENKKNGNVQHLRDHSIEPEEAEECFYHNYRFHRDARRFDDVYILDGRTNRGRQLRLVFQDKGNSVARVFTGWDLKRKKVKK
jgi:uncharacterized DUF497 family protein